MRKVANFMGSGLYRSLAGKNREERELIIENYIQTRNLSRDELQTEIGFLNSDEDKEKLAQTWLQKEGFERSLEDLQGVLPFIADNWTKYSLAKNWLNKDERNLDDLQDALTLLPDELSKYSLVKTWLEKGGRTLEDLKGALPFVTDVVRKSNLAENWLNKDRNSENRYHNLLSLVQSESFCTRYDIRRIVSVYTEVALPINKIGEFCKDLCPLSENLQVEIFKEFLQIYRQDKLIKSKTELTSFVQAFNSDEYALQALNALTQQLH